MAGTGPIGRVLAGRYRLEVLVGQGGMAQVYRGLDLKLQRPVAIKWLWPHLAEDPVVRERFRREALAAAALDHPFIVDIYDVEEEDGRPFLVMEWVGGGDLASRLREGPLPLPEALRIAEEVALALDHAHRRGIVHRDVKPHNILLTEEGHVRVVDFGLAFRPGSGRLTEDGFVMGTAAYLAPEQAQGKEATPASDLYALGVTLFEMLTGEPPFKGETPVSVALQHVQAPPPSPRSLAPSLPPEVEGVILRAMAKDPQKRFPSAREMARVLARIRMGLEEETAAIPIPPPSPTQPEPFPVRTPASGTTAVGTATSVPSPPRPVPPPRTRRTSTATPAVEAGAGGIGWRFLLLLFLVLAGLAGLVPTWRWLFSAPSTTPTPAPSQAVVPDLRGLSPEEARALLTARGFKVRVGESRSDPQVPAGRVAAQEPPPGTSLTQGEEVVLFLSAGPPRVAVPEVVRLPFAEAARRLQIAGFRVARVEEGSPTVPEGSVIRQEPIGGLLVPQGITVTLYVSMGDRVQVPDLIGLTLEEAQQALEAVGLQLGFVNYQTQEDMPPGVDIAQFPVGTVISSLPVKGTWVSRGSVVHIAIRKE